MSEYLQNGFWFFSGEDVAFVTSGIKYAMMAGALVIGIVAVYRLARWILAKLKRSTPKPKATSSPDEIEKFAARQLDDLGKLLSSINPKMRDDALEKISDASDFCKNVATSAERLALLAETYGDRANLISKAMDALLKRDKGGLVECAAEIDFDEELYFLLNSRPSFQNEEYWSETYLLCRSHLGELKKWGTKYIKFSSGLIHEIGVQKRQIFMIQAAMDFSEGSEPLRFAVDKLGVAESKLRLTTMIKRQLMAALPDSGTPPVLAEFRQRMAEVTLPDGRG